MKLRNINVSETVWESQTEGIRVQHDQYALNYLVWNFHKNFKCFFRKQKEQCTATCKWWSITANWDQEYDFPLTLCNSHERELAFIREMLCLSYSCLSGIKLKMNILICACYCLWVFHFKGEVFFFYLLFFSLPCFSFKTGFFM